jgi:hypothetical protein
MKLPPSPRRNGWLADPNDDAASIFGKSIGQSAKARRARAVEVKGSLREAATLCDGPPSSMRKLISTFRTVAHTEE